MSLDKQYQVAKDVNAAVEDAAVTTSTLLAQNKIAYAVIGGYALKLLGNDRMTFDLDLLVEEEPISVRTRLIEMDGRFSITPRNKLCYKAGNAEVIEVEILRGGSAGVLALPSPVDASKYVESTIIILHPKLLISTKIKRWMHIAGSTRPQSIRKGNSDLGDIKYLLDWLAARHIKIDFDGYASLKPKHQLLLGYRLLYHKHSEFIGRLREVLEKEDFEFVGSQN